MNSTVKILNFLIVNFKLLKNNSKFFTAEFIEKNFENFLQSISLKKKSKFFTANFIEKNFENFSENPNKNFLPNKKKGGNGTFFPAKSDMTFVGF